MTPLTKLSASFIFFGFGKLVTISDGQSSEESTLELEEDVSMMIAMWRTTNWFKDWGKNNFKSKNNNPNIIYEANEMHVVPNKRFANFKKQTYNKNNII